MRNLSKRQRVIVIAAAAVFLIVVAATVFAAMSSARVNSNRVCLDPGHGGSDVGAVSADGRYEKDDNLRLALAVRDELEKLGADVVMTRDEDKTVSLEDRVKKAERKNAGVIVSLHRNSADDKTACGVEVWATSKHLPADTMLASAIMDELDRAGIQKNRGVRFGYVTSSVKDYYINSESSMPSCLAEIGFMSNEQDNKLFDENFDEYAAAIARGIASRLTLETEEASEDE